MDKFKKWVKPALIRAIKTFSQTFLATVGTNAMFMHQVNWGAVVSASTLAFILSLVTSTAGLPEIDK